jgi:hypothetical protein
MIFIVLNDKTLLFCQFWLFLFVIQHLFWPCLIVITLVMKRRWSYQKEKITRNRMVEFIINDVFYCFSVYVILAICEGWWTSMWCQIKGVMIKQWTSKVFCFETFEELWWWWLGEWNVRQKDLKDLWLEDVEPMI